MDNKQKKTILQSNYDITTKHTPRGVATNEVQIRRERINNAFGGQQMTNAVLSVDRVRDQSRRKSTVCWSGPADCKSLTSRAA
eukprot:14550959-Ditylum_brightwellii.AAC.1